MDPEHPAKAGRKEQMVRCRNKRERIEKQGKIIERARKKDYGQVGSKTCLAKERVEFELENGRLKRV
jgi:hypothetical protein